MISKKILYNEQLLQLVLALSLLQVDPVNYLEWGISRIHASDGSPWQLEVSHQPFSEFPYMGRKHYAPFIEDLDNRFRGHDLQAYLLNLSDPPSNNSNNSTANDQSNGNTTDSHIAPTLNLMQQLNESSVDELFLHSDSHHALGSDIIEQNLADLNDYGETHEAAAPLRETKLGLADDPWDEFVRLQDVEILDENRRILNFGTFPSSFSWDQAFNSNNDSIANLQDDETSTQKEEQMKENTETSDDVNELSNISSVELTAEEMDLIEVLWKQDVDLGYNPLPANNPSLLPAQKESKGDDDVEKLKALLELKADEKSDNNSSNPWAGYTVDTETGEYILSSKTSNEELDELLLKEALQFVNDSDSKDFEPALNQGEPKTAQKKSADNSEETEDLEAVLSSNLELDSGLQNDDLDFVLNSPLSSLFDETDDLNLFNDMMIQSSASHFQHPRQPPQNYPHCVNGYRQNNYQGRVPLARSATMEQRWQDLANLLSFPPAMGMTDMSAHSAAAHYSPHYYQASSLNHSHPAVLHNASLAEIVSQSQPSTSHHLQPYSSSNLGSAVASSMHLTNSTSETDAGNSAYKMDHDMMYYSQANPAELNHTSDGFLNMLKDEDLQLMDMAMNEGLYTMGMLDQNGSAAAVAAANPHLTANGLMGSHLSVNLSSGLGTTMVNSTNASGTNDRLDASSDSAVSSMGSERVASLSDGEWNEAGSDSAQEYNVRKFIGPYDYRFGGARMLDSNRHPVAQKKHQMYGKRSYDANILPPPPPAMHHPHSSLVPAEAVPNVPMKFEPYDNFTGVDSAVASSSSHAAVASAKASTSSESEMKYSYTLDYHHRHMMKNGSGISTQELVNHNHTYTLPPHGPQLLNNNGANPRPQTRDKKSKKSDDEHYTRDEKRARALQIPIPVYDIINLPMDEFNERLSKYDLSENQLSLIRDIRRRGKNKVAAQNCRKRKLDQIISLADEVKDMKMRKDRFLREHDMLLTERRRIKDKFSALYRHVFTNLRDPEGNPYSSYQYSLQQSADGGIVLVPRSSDQSSDQSGSNSTTSRGSGHNAGNGSSSNFK